MHHPLLAFGRGLASEEHEVARLEVGEVGGDVDMLPHVGLLGGVAGDDDVVHEEHCAHEAATIHAFRRGACPKIGHPHQRVGRANDAGGILLQALAPFLFWQGCGLLHIALSAVGIGHAIEATLCAFQLQAVACHNVGHRLRASVGLGVDEGVVRRDHDLFCPIPSRHFLAGDGQDADTMRPGDIVVGRLNAIPSVALKYAHGHA